MILAGCSGGNDREDEEVILKHIVIEYNRLLADGYRNLNMSGLLEVATEERAQKAYYHMAALGEGREKMDAVQRSISFEDIKILSESAADVRTREEWDYKHFNIDSGQQVFEDRVSYELTYKLIRKDQKWYIGDIQIEKEEKVNIKAQ